MLVASGLYALVRRLRRRDGSATLDGVMRWYKECGLFMGIAIVFTLITVINNIMMLTGIDAPKQGLFAYQHMLVRIAIVTGAVMVAMGRESVKALLICVAAIIVSPWREVAGGAPFYIALLVLYGVLLVVFGVIRLARR